MFFSVMLTLKFHRARARRLTLSLNPSTCTLYDNPTTDNIVVFTFNVFPSISKNLKCNTQIEYYSITFLVGVLLESYKFYLKCVKILSEVIGRLSPPYSQWRINYFPDGRGHQPWAWVKSIILQDFCQKLTSLALPWMHQCY